MRRFLAILLMLTLPIAAQAQSQSPATLVADRVIVSADGQLIADGNVEVFHDGTVLSAAGVIYDQRTNQLTLEGPLTVVTPDGTIFQASEASLDPGLRNGLLLGARLVLNRQLQLSASRIDRVDGRYSQLREVAATSCRVCNGQAPLWEIRAGSVIHDDEERQLYFENAQFLVRGVPILWVPRLRLPDPSLDRATGFLTPNIRSSNRLGIGLRLPYFIRLGDARDLTITPYVSTQTRTLEFRYRQAYDTGFVQLDGALTDDDLRPGETRGFATATGAFALPRDYLLSFDLESVADRAYLLDYGLSDTDVLQSDLAVMRVREDRYFRSALSSFESLRAGDDNDLLPGLVAEVQFERRLTPGLIGGTLTLQAGADSFLRADETDVSGRDMTRFGGALDWHRNWVSGPGIMTEAELHFGVDVFAVKQDSTVEDVTTRSDGGAVVTLRWPLAGTAQNGARHLVEPVVQLAWSEQTGGSVPNEDSVVAELDEGNLLSLSRFAGEDAVETGLRGAVGLSWTREGPGGMQSTLSFGRVFRETEELRFSQSSGLRGARSDWLISGQFDFSEGLSLGVRSLMDDTANFTKTEARMDWSTDALALSAAYVFLPDDPDEGRTDPVSEWTFDAAYQVNEAWAISGEARYDLVADQPARAEIGVEWRNECALVGLSVSRRFTSSANVEPSTDLDLSVELLGFSASGAAAGAARACDR